MRRDDVQLSGWGTPDGAGWVRTGAGYRPTVIEAHFTVADEVRVTVTANGTADGVELRAYAAKSISGDALPDEDIDRRVLVEILADATIVEFRPDYDRPEFIRIAGGPELRAASVRDWLSGPAGRTKPGPPKKVPLERVAKLWLAATRKGKPAAQNVADGCDVSIATAHRYIAAARKAGLIEETNK